MVTVTAEAFHEKLEADDKEIILNGPPSNLKGHIFLRNNNDDVLNVRTLSLKHDKKHEKILGGTSELKISRRLRPGEENFGIISHQLPLETPPGTYESTLMVGGAEKKITIIVQPHIEVNIHPSRFSFTEAKPGKVLAAQFTLTNLGNLPFEVPDVKHIAALDMDLICRALGNGIRSKGAEGYEAVLDEIARNIKENIPDWASTRVEEAGQTLAPGASMIAHLNITVPKNTDETKDYAGSMRFWDKQINYTIKSQTGKKPNEKNYGKQNKQSS